MEKQNKQNGLYALLGLAVSSALTKAVNMENAWCVLLFTLVITAIVLLIVWDIKRNGA